MDALNFFKFWRNNTPTTTTTSNITVPHLVVETDTESDEDDSFFDLELTINDDPPLKTTNITTFETAVNVVPHKTTVPLSPNEPISKRKVLPIEPTTKPQSPISLLKSAPSFRIFTFRKQRTPSEKTEHEQTQKKQTKVFAVKVNTEDFHSTPSLSRDNSTRSFASKARNQGTEEPKTERVSKEILLRYLKLIKPLYVKVSKRYSEKVKFPGDRVTVMASPSSSPVVQTIFIHEVLHSSHFVHSPNSLIKPKTQQPNSPTNSLLSLHFLSLDFPMDALNFFKFWRNNTPTTTTTSNITVPHLVVETDTESDEDDSFFDLELTINDDPPLKTTNITTYETAVNVVPHKTKVPLSSNEPISKRKVLPIEPITKPQSPISLLKSAPSFRIFTFRKQRTASEKTEHEETQKKQAKVFAVKVNMEDLHSTPSLSRDNSTRSFASKARSQGTDEPKTERVSKEILLRYLKLIKPLYVKVSKRYSEKVKFPGDRVTVMGSPSSSPVVQKQGNFPAGMRVVSKHFGKSRSSGTVVGVGSPAKRSDDTLLQQHDGIQSAILHCKKSFNSRDCSMGVAEDKSMCSTRSSFEDEV
ncbi:uncharacterized protein LOC131649616 [Vicia villosa]|uniref:uncharacterized protein LOC131649616 n=1 Tax=Vicia villosa TaxID=3911 RepID=UPI00273B925A|nr:uncharacterized protein LOC131649616 [Vicia villosa]